MEVAVVVTVAPEVALNPVAGLHEYEFAPEALSVVELPEQIFGLFTVTDGFGFTVIVNVIEVPVQPFKEGLTVMVEVIGALVLFNKLNEGIFPVPDEAKPIAGLLFDQV